MRERIDMNLFESIASGFRHYVNFRGRALRSQYWWWTLFVSVVAIIANVIQNATNIDWLFAVVALALFLPGLSVAIRRLHDTNRRGWWILIGLIPIVGWIILFIWYVSKGTEGDNNYGPPIYS
jgi:uncharacterized membrane protein YhaH (DUF805 family)